MRPNWTAALLASLPLAAGAQPVQWETVPAAVAPTRTPVWTQLPRAARETHPQSVVWEPVPDLEEPIADVPDVLPPRSAEEAAALLDGLIPLASDYLPLLRLGPSIPTANQVEGDGAQLSFYQLAPIAGGGDAGGTGNQNYVGRLDLGINDQIQLSGFYSEADDPLFSAVRINGELANPSNFWQSYGGALQWQVLDQKTWKLGFSGSLEGWNVGSGGALGAGQVSQFGSPNIFNNSGQRVYTNNTVGSLALPLSWQASKTVELTFTPGVSFLPSTQGAGQGGGGHLLRHQHHHGGGRRLATVGPGDPLRLRSAAPGSRRQQL